MEADGDLHVPEGKANAGIGNCRGKCMVVYALFLFTLDCICSVLLCNKLNFNEHSLTSSQFCGLEVTTTWLGPPLREPEATVKILAELTMLGA